MVKVDLNSDIGESFGVYNLGMDTQVLQHITSANIACGWHAGDPLVLQKTIACAKENGVAIGAHPGFPDLLGFGRRNLAISPDELYAYTLYQLGAFAAFARAQGLPIQHLKAHGAMYNMAGQDIRLALALARAVRDFDSQIILLCLAGSKMIEAAVELGLPYASEVFADRAYEEDGSLVSRGKEGAMIHDENLAIERVVKMVANGRVTAINGKEIAVRADSICVHGDNIHAVAFVGKIHAALSAAGITVAALNN